MAGYEGAGAGAGGAAGKPGWVPGYATMVRLGDGLENGDGGEVIGRGGVHVDGASEGEELAAGERAARPGVRGAPDPAARRLSPSLRLAGHFARTTAWEGLENRRNEKCNNDGEQGESTGHAPPISKSYSRGVTSSFTS